MTEVITQLASRPIYRNRWLSLREDKVRFPGGHEGIYTVVEKSDFATIIPVHDDGRIQLVRQYRYPVGGSYWELPQGHGRPGTRRSGRSGAWGSWKKRPALRLANSKR